MAGRWRVVVLVLALWGGRAEGAPAGEPVRGRQAECLTCHQGRDPELVAQWRASRHAATAAACPACHGTDHDGRMAARSRRNDACSGCHEVAAKSYTLSKHGVIATLEGERWDWSQPLREANTRAPTCAYCHNSHALGRADDAPCRDCHAPRLVETWFASGERMVELGRMKVREATEVVATIRQRNPERADQARTRLAEMRDVHLRNVRLGVGHQSPDDQWWHGHPALDGDLLRIKGLRGE